MYQITLKDDYWKFDPIQYIWWYMSFCEALTDFERFVNLPDMTLEFIWLDDF